jgi:predicted phosphoadenosine phosphosulfate sulfurtransferase
MKIYKSTNVLDEALNRIRLIFDEFPNIVVSMSGGKDSTVVFNLVKQVAKERGMLPLKVMWLDQECEFSATVDYMRDIMYDKDVEPLWYQVPFRLLNATSAEESWLNVWGEGEEWVREQDPVSFKENNFGTDRFVDLMEKIIVKDYSKVPTAVFTGVRGEESPTRFMGLTGAATYKWITWGNVIDRKKDVYNFHPIYDWTYMDVWKYIHDNNLEYNHHYNEMYRYGVPLRNMRVSNYHHETAVHALFMLQEIEPDTYAKATQRISGLDTAGKMGKDDWFIKELPFMFNNWLEYRDYLLENLVTDPKLKIDFAKTFDSIAARYPHEVNDSLYKAEINSILCNDVDMTKLKNWEARHNTKEQLERKLAHEAKFN